MTAGMRYLYPNRFKTSRHPRKTQDLGPFASQQRRITKAIEEIANNEAIDKKSRILELEQIAEEIYDVWEAMIDDCDHTETMLLVKRRAA